MLVSNLVRRTVLFPAVFFLICGALQADLIPDVRAAIARNDFKGGEQLIAQYRATKGVTNEMIAAMSWLGRGALAQKRLEEAERYAQETYALAEKQLKKHKIDADRDLEIGLGAAIEVQGQVLGARGERTAAVAYLQDQLKKYSATKVHTRIQKNINLLSLEGKPAPELTGKVLTGPRLALKELKDLKGKPVLLFFWAHWCGDCKQQGPAIARLQSELGARGLVVMAPTQLYGYVGGGKDAGAAEETAYIRQVLQQFYPDLKNVTVTLGTLDFQRYGSSTTPTLVLVDKQGIVRLYHPGKMSFEDLKARIAALLS